MYIGAGRYSCTYGCTWKVLMYTWLGKYSSTHGWEGTCVYMGGEVFVYNRQMSCVNLRMSLNTSNNLRRLTKGGSSEVMDTLSIQKSSFE